MSAMTPQEMKELVGKPLGTSEWVLVDATTMRPHRIPADMLPTFERR